MKKIQAVLLLLFIPSVVPVDLGDIASGGSMGGTGGAGVTFKFTPSGGGGGGGGGASSSYYHNSASVPTKSTKYIDITKDLTNVIVEILQTFDDTAFKNSSANWNFYEYKADAAGEVKNRQHEHIKYSFFNTSKHDISVSRSDNIRCNFHHTLQVNTFNYKKVLALGNFTYTYNISSENLISRDGVINVHIKNVDIFTELIIKSTSEASIDYYTNMTYGEITAVILLKDDHPLEREKRIYLGHELSDSLITLIKNQIKNAIKIPIRPIYSICKEPIRIIKTNYPEFVEQLPENQYYFAMDRGRIDISKLVNRSQVIDVSIQGLTNIKSIHVSYPDWVNGDIIHELRIENLKGMLTWVQYSTELTKLKFEIDSILLTVNKMKNKINEVRIRTGNFSVVPVTSKNQTAHIKKEFESLAEAFFYERLSGDFITRFKNNSSSNSTHFIILNSTESTPVQQPQFYISDEDNIGLSLARAIAEILKKFHKDAMQSITKHVNKNIGNQGPFSNLEMSATIFNVQEEICDFAKRITVKYDDVWIELKGIILGSNNDKSHDPKSESIPFAVNINRLIVSRQRYDAECLANIGENDKTVLLNSTTYRYKQNDKQNFKNEILKFVQSESGRMDNYTDKFSYHLCMNPGTTIKSIKTGEKIHYVYSREYYGIMNNLIDTTFHIPVKLNQVKVYGLQNFASINTTKIYNGTIFRLIIRDLSIEVEWQYYTSGSYLTKPKKMNFHADSIELAGKINENGTQLEFTDDSRLVLTFSENPPPPNELITVERVKNKINETIISSIQYSIKEAY